MFSYIYKFTNKENGMVYIGQTIAPKERYKTHFYGESFFGREIRRLGYSSFDFEIIEKINLEDANERECYWISYFDSYKNGYNSTIGGSGILQPKPVFCIELELSFSSISDAANAIICETGSTLELETVKKRISKALNNLELTVEELHFCSPEVAEDFSMALNELFN